MPIPLKEIVSSVKTENPWWSNSRVPQRFENMGRRAYFVPFHQLTTNWKINRAVILLGPRRVGKTVMTHHLVSRLIADGFSPKHIMYVSIDTPTYTGQSLDFFVDLHSKQNDIDKEAQRVVIFDEIQYLPQWERHLKSLVDKNPNVRFVASGSAAAALKLASAESGAGRFTEFMLPPLTFSEYLTFIGRDDLMIFDPAKDAVSFPGRSYFPTCSDIDHLNNEFINYINYGGYPEAVVSEDIRMDAARFIKNDIIDKVLLRDLPQLYGITNIQELNNLFTSIAYHTGQEMSLESLAQNSGISKPTITKYIEYLEAAFLIFRVRRVDHTAKTFARERTFKVYLTNPSMRAALFSPVDEQNENFGSLVETAVFSQWFHSLNRNDLHYARWSRSGQKKAKLGDHGEIDLVHIQTEMRPNWLVEVRWSDQAYKRLEDWRSIEEFVGNNRTIKNGSFTTKTATGQRTVGSVHFNIMPSAVYCYTVGRNTLKTRDKYVKRNGELVDIEPLEVGEEDEIAI